MIKKNYKKIRGAKLLIDRSGEEYIVPRHINDPDQIIKEIALSKNIHKSLQERMIVVSFNAHNEVMDVMEVSIGTKHGLNAPIDTILTFALMSGATWFSVLHNHPTGNCEPSKEDEEFSKRLFEASKMMQCPLISSIVIDINGNTKSVNMY